MLWTRKYFDQWEWYHRPVSPMEKSLLLPVHINQALSLITKRLGIKFPKHAWAVINGYLYMTAKYKSVLFQPTILLLPFRFWSKLSWANQRWTNQILPVYRKRLINLEKIDLKTKTTKKLISLLKEIAVVEGEFLAESVYVVLFAIFSEVLLKTAYKLMIKDGNFLNYHELLVGYPDKGIEADRRLWEIAGLREDENKTNRLREWIKEYGHRIQDKDILYPTLGETPATIKAFLKLYRETPNPADKVKAAVNARKSREVYAGEHLRFPLISKRFFNWTKSLAQEYAKIRNSRPYEYRGNAIIRRILLQLGGRITVLKLPQEVFYLTINELETAAGGNLDSGFRQNLVDRIGKYQKQSAVSPPLTVKL